MPDDGYEWPDEIQGMWDKLEDAVADPERVADWIGEAESLFHTGWIDLEADHDDRIAARDEFFALMEEFDISEEHFDWDAWRDWYKESA